MTRVRDETRYLADWLTALNIVPVLERLGQLGCAIYAWKLDTQHTEDVWRYFRLDVRVFLVSKRFGERTRRGDHKQIQQFLAESVWKRIGRVPSAATRLGSQTGLGENRGISPLSNRHINVSLRHLRISIHDNRSVWKGMEMDSKVQDPGRPGGDPRTGQESPQDDSLESSVVRFAGFYRSVDLDPVHSTTTCGSWILGILLATIHGASYLRLSVLHLVRCSSQNPVPLPKFPLDPSSLQQPEQLLHRISPSVRARLQWSVCHNCSNVVRSTSVNSVEFPRVQRDHQCRSPHRLRFTFYAPSLGTLLGRFCTSRHASSETFNQLPAVLHVVRPTLRVILSWSASGWTQTGRPHRVGEGSERMWNGVCWNRWFRTDQTKVFVELKTTSRHPTQHNMPCVLPANARDKNETFSLGPCKRNYYTIIIL